MGCPAVNNWSAWVGREEQRSDVIGAGLAARWLATLDRVVQIYGGAGYLAEYDAERFFRDARIYRIYEGTTQILQLQIAKHMLREWAAQQ